MIELVRDFADASAWDSFVTAHPQGRFAHLYGYRCIERVYGYRPHYLGFVRSGRLVGILPTFEARSLLFGRRILSQPFSEYGGGLLQAGLSQDEQHEVVELIRNYLRELGYQSLEMHGNQGMRTTEPGITSANPQMLAYLPLDRPVEDIFAKVISRHVRKALNKAEREGLTCRQAADADTIRRWFYPLYVSSMTRLGSPPHSLDYFLACQDAMPENLRIFWAVRGDTPVAGLLGFSCGKRVSIINIVSDKAFWELRPNDLVHWEFIKWAGTSGFDYFDFGSVRYDGQMQFKKKWGCVMEESGYFYIAADADRVAEKAFDSSAGAMGLASSLWARFMPEGAAVHLGPLLRRHLIR